MTKDEVIRNIIHCLKTLDKTSIYSPSTETAFAISFKSTSDKIKVSLGRYPNSKCGYLIYASNNFNRRYQLNSVEVILINEIMSTIEKKRK